MAHPANCVALRNDSEIQFPAEILWERDNSIGFAD
jgi:hypothetical protein